MPSRDAMKIAAKEYPTPSYRTPLGDELLERQRVALATLIDQGVSELKHAAIGTTLPGRPLNDMAKALEGWATTDEEATQ